MTVEVESTGTVNPAPDCELPFIRAVASLELPKLAVNPANSYSRVGDVAPLNLSEVIADGNAFAAISVIGGPASNTRYTPTIDIHVFSRTQRVSGEVANQIVAFWMQTPILIRDESTVINVENSRVSVHPAEVPYDPDRTIRRYTASVQVAVRR